MAEERVAAIRSRINRSLGDARPPVAIDDAFERLERKHKQEQCDLPK